MYLPLGVPDYCLHTSYGQKHLLRKQNSAWLILYLGVKSFGQHYVPIVSDKHLFKQGIQQNQFQINLSIN